MCSLSCIVYKCAHYRVLGKNVLIIVYCVQMCSLSCIVYKCAHYRVLGKNVLIIVYWVQMYSLSCIVYKCAHYRVLGTNVLICYFVCRNRMPLLSHFRNKTTRKVKSKKQLLKIQTQKIRIVAKVITLQNVILQLSSKMNQFVVPLNTTTQEVITMTTLLDLIQTQVSTFRQSNKKVLYH